MKLPLMKIDSCGNSYFYFSLFHADTADFFGKLSEAERTAFVKTLSDRRRGIGSDGVILVSPAKEADAEMRIFNADGSEGNLCGNGLCATARFLQELGLCRKEHLSLRTKSGVRQLTQSAGDCFRVNLGQPNWACPQIPMQSETETWINRPLTIEGTAYQTTALSLGNPHLVVTLEHPNFLKLSMFGPKFEHHPAFTESVNTEFITRISAEHYVARVWERGSGETLSCGSGAAAIGAVAVRLGLSPPNLPIRIAMPGGNLFVTVTDRGVLLESAPKVLLEGWIFTEDSAFAPFHIQTGGDLFYAVKAR